MVRAALGMRRIERRDALVLPAKSGIAVLARFAVEIGDAIGKCVAGRYRLGAGGAAILEQFLPAAPIALGRIGDGGSPRSRIRGRAVVPGRSGIADSNAAV